MFQQTKLRPWINIQHLKFSGLSWNPNAIHILCNNMDKIDPNGLMYLQNVHKSDYICELVNEYNKTHRTKTKDIDSLSADPTAIDFLRSNPKKICLDLLVINTNPEAMKLINKKKLTSNHRKSLSMNPGAINFLKSNPSLIDWEYLAYNSNPDTISMFINRIRRSSRKSRVVKSFNWKGLSEEPSVNIYTKIIFEQLARNQDIFTYDYDEIKQSKQELNDSFEAFKFNPIFIRKYIETYGYDALDSIDEWIDSNGIAWSLSNYADDTNALT